MAGHGHRHAGLRPRRQTEGLGKAVPYGVCDIGSNRVFVVVGNSAGTTGFSVGVITTQWERVGKERHPHANAILITCDGGGSYSAKARLWKPMLQRFADATGPKASAVIDRNTCERGIRVGDVEEAALSVVREDLLGEWNYMMLPRPTLDRLAAWGRVMARPQVEGTRARLRFGTGRCQIR